MPNDIPEMVDLAFDLEGGTIPVAYQFPLWAEIVRLAPKLAEEKQVGILPLRTSVSNEGLLLPKRAKLVLRLPTTLAGYAAACLSGQQLKISANTGHTKKDSLFLGKSKPLQIHPHPTIHAQLVTGTSDEIMFMNDIMARLSKMNITAKLVCGKHRTLIGGQHAIHGFSLALHDLKPEASLQLQYAGLGEERRFGCGIFVPHKTISGL